MYNPMPYEDAKDMEVELGIALREGGFGFWVLGFGFWVLGFGFWVLGFGFWQALETTSSMS